MILYIHGFRSTANSDKAIQFKAHFGEGIVISSHSFSPSVAIVDLEKIIETKGVTAIMGSSLGGYYATYLGNKYKLKTVLINPSSTPHITLEQYVGEITDHDGVLREWRTEHLEELSRLWVDELIPDDYYLLLKAGDEVLDYTVAKKRYAGSMMQIDEGGDHGFGDIMQYIGQIEHFL